MKSFPLFLFLFFTISCAHRISTQESLEMLSKEGGIKILVDALAKENLLHNTVTGMVVGITTPTEGIRYFSYGYRDRETQQVMTPDTLFQLGSITKVFTASLLSVLEEERQITLQDSLKDYMPPNFNPRTKWVSDITLEQLASHSSGLTSEYHNFEMLLSSIYFLWSGENIWKNLTQKKLFQYIEEHDFRTKKPLYYKYSNVAYVLLGGILDLKYPEKKYEGLLKEKITDPLELYDTVFNLKEEQQSRLSSGYSGSAPPLIKKGIKMRPWNFKVGLNAAGGLYSTALDMMKFLLINMTDNQSLLGKSFKKAQKKRIKFKDGHIGLGWFLEILKRSQEPTIYHNGIIGGHTSYLGYHEKSNIGVVVLQNAMNMNYEFGETLLDLLVLSRK